MTQAFERAPVVVGRDAELAQLDASLRSARDGHGTTRFVAGDLGTGKQALIDEALRRFHADGDDDVLVVTGTCQREYEQQNAYEPFAEILLQLLSEGRARRARDAVLTALKEVAPDWLGMVPLVGAGLEASVKTVLRAREVYAGEEQEDAARVAQSRQLQFLSALERRLERTPLIVLVISQAQWLDGPSAGLLERVARFAEEHPLAVWVTYRLEDVTAGHPLVAIERTLVVDGLADKPIRLEGLDAAAIDRYVRAQLGAGISPEAAAWLQNYTEGNPLFLSQFLPLIVERGVLVNRDGFYGFDDDAVLEDGELRLSGALENVEIPARVGFVLDERIDRLDPPDRELLEVAAVEGARFLNVTLAKVTKADDLNDLIRRLDVIEKRYGLIRYFDALQQQLFRYEFTHLLIRQRVYERLPGPLRLVFHQQIADVFVATFGEEASRSILLDIARHYEEGLNPAAAAKFLARAAASALADGATPHAASLSRRALALLDEAARRPQPEPADTLRAETVAVLAAAAWEDARAGDAELLRVVAEGRKAAERAGDAALRARLLHAEGVCLLSAQSAEAAARTLEEARAAARAADDPETELAAAIDLGNTLAAVEGIDRALAVLNEARASYQAQTAAGRSTPELQRLAHRLDAFAGIGEFDRGDLGAARRLLDTAITGSRELGGSADLVRMLNYRSQIELASGEPEAAAEDLRRALAHPNALEGPWHAYNESFLGKVLLAVGRTDEARRHLRSAYEEAQQAWQVRLGNHVRQYLSEFLLRDGSSADEIAEAEAIVAELVCDAEAAGFRNVVAIGKSLAAEAALRRGDSSGAIAVSAEAVAIVDGPGHLAVIRTDEVLARHARCLDAAGQPGGDAFRERAREILARKAASLPDGEARRRMRESDPLARELL